jgi:hypothetical protein
MSSIDHIPKHELRESCIGFRADFRNAAISGLGLTAMLRKGGSQREPPRTWGLLPTCAAYPHGTISPRLGSTFSLNLAGSGRHRFDIALQRQANAHLCAAIDRAGDRQIRSSRKT